MKAFTWLSSFIKITVITKFIPLTLSRRRTNHIETSPLISIDLQSKLMGWFLYNYDNVMKELKRQEGLKPSLETQKYIPVPCYQKEVATIQRCILNPV